MEANVERNTLLSNCYPYWFFEELGNKYVYSAYSNQVLQIDDAVYKFIVDHDTSDDSYDYNEITNILEKTYIFKSEKMENKLKEVYDKIKKNNSPHFESAVLMISQACNLRCIYCYGENGEYQHKGFMSFDTAKATIDMLFATTDKSKDISIVFFGGEPLLSFPLMKEIVNYGNEKARKLDRKILYSMTTNGTLITDEIEEYIIENHISTQISMDGTEEVHNANRYYANHNGCYDDVIKNTKRLRERGMLTVRATVSPKGLDLKKNISHLSTLNYKHIAWATSDNLLKDSDYTKLEKESDKLLDYVEELIAEEKYDEIRKYTMIMSTLERLNTPRINFPTCGAGKGMIAVDINGDIYPCQRFVGNEHFKLSNINLLDEGDISNKNFYKQNDIFQFKKCMNCSVRGACLGTCINDNYTSTGSMNEPKTVECAYIEKFCKRLIRIFVRLNAEQKEKLFEKQKSNKTQA